ncbi:uncharacterized protein SCHCODRAFT_02672128 [Schizophyllum commune H4-8]|nr:uncharacterized protein SCHCODRAFT_02672128 [Schizophyllum commune H4-8]KAI5886939.1 hypothetical protein SCHCODRAFT_02672128 [Schizophyllum commune H4-8]
MLGLEAVDLNLTKPPRKASSTLDPRFERWRSWPTSGKWPAPMPSNAQHPMGLSMAVKAFVVAGINTTVARKEGLADVVKFERVPQIDEGSGGGGEVLWEPAERIFAVPGRSSPRFIPRVDPLVTEMPERRRGRRM